MPQLCLAVASLALSTSRPVCVVLLANRLSLVLPYLKWYHTLLSSAVVSKQTASVGSSPLERGNRAVGNCWDYANQCSACARVGTARTNGVSTPARVVSGCEAQKREETARTGCDLVLCALVAVDRASVGAWESADGLGAGCHEPGRALDDFIHQRHTPQLRYSSGVESAGWA